LVSPKNRAEGIALIKEVLRERWQVLPVFAFASSGQPTVDILRQALVRGSCPHDHEKHVAVLTPRI
jgi:hypothetical protein